MSDGGPRPGTGRGGGSDARSDARERALTLLYEAEQRRESVAAVAEGHSGYLEGLAGEIALGVERRMAEIDGLVSSASTTWPMVRMAAIDRAVLRIGVFELLERQGTPTAVVIDEAVELAKRFSTEGSGRFVNGILSAVDRVVRRSD